MGLLCISWILAFLKRSTSSGKPYQLAWPPLAWCVRNAHDAQMSVYVVAPVRNENEVLVKFKDPTMVCRLFAVNNRRGRERNYVNLLFSVFHLATVGYCVWSYQCFICCWRRFAVNVITLHKDNNLNVSSDDSDLLASYSKSYACLISDSFFSYEQMRR